MFTSTTNTASSHHEYPILDQYCPPIRPLIMMDSTTSKWKCNNVELAPNCPRCASSDTKFCYYNNYSLSQPRYFCKGCRRYWTKGGSLRNVPVGGGCRKSRRSRRHSAGGGVSPKHADPTDNSVSAGSSTVGTEIDLAVVFAKYVNHNMENNNSNNEESSSPGSASGGSSSSDNVRTCTSSEMDDHSPLEDSPSTMVATMFDQCEVNYNFDLINGCDNDHEMQVHRPNIFINDQDINGIMQDNNFMNDDSNVFELLGDDCGVAQDTLWSNMRLQDSGIFSDDDQFGGNSTNLVSDNWDSLDLSSYESFSKKFEI